MVKIKDNIGVQYNWSSLTAISSTIKSNILGQASCGLSTVTQISYTIRLGTVALCMAEISVILSILWHKNIKDAWFKYSIIIF